MIHFGYFFREKFSDIPLSKTWLLGIRCEVETLPLKTGRRILARRLGKKIRAIHRRFSGVYAPYSKKWRWSSSLTTVSAPETLLLPTRWLLKKHAAVAAEFRSLETLLARASFEGMAPLRFLELALTLDQYVEKTAFRFSEETLSSTLNDWQEEQGLFLSLAETESISLLLRLLALDKLSAVAVRLSETEQARARATEVFLQYGADRARHAPIVRDIEKKFDAEYRDSFLLSLEEHILAESLPKARLREHASAGAPKKRVAETESATRVRVLLRSLSLLGEFEWNSILKKTNVLHKLLVRDPSGIYAHMTSDSQEFYRSRAATLAGILHLSEEAVAKAALALSEEASDTPENHIGFFLIDDGFSRLIPRLTGKERLPFRYVRVDRTRLPLLQNTYIASVLISSLCATFFFAVFFLKEPLFAVVLFPLLYKGGKHLTDSLFSGFVPPTFLPRLSFKRGIPDSVSAVFVIPALLKDERTLSALISKLETASLSTTRGRVGFCLLLDYTDSPTETRPDDALLLSKTHEAFRLLNERAGQTDRFFFVLRSRIWSKEQGRWMGWERKRGKLLDFARLLRNKAPSSPFILSASRLPEAEFVITLDEDAFISRDFVKNILSVHAHPLQKPLMKGAVRKHGYTLLQPHVKQWFKNRHRFRLPHIFFDERRFSAYSSVFPEIYQDIFLEGSYAGKGSFHVDAFLAALDNALPADQILSHDLLEGSFAKAAYVADIDAFDEFPKSLRAMLARSHRWTRGDWQITDWLFSRVRNANGKHVKNPLLFIHKFKIADNLWQSLFRPAVFFATLLAWLFDNPKLLLLVWTLFLFELLFLDMFLDWGRWIFHVATGEWKHLFYRLKKTVLRTARLVRQALFECSVLPMTAIDTMHAISVALFRRFKSGKNMLEWVPASHFEKPSGRNPLIFPFLLLLFIAISVWFERTVHPFFGALLLVWMTLPIWTILLNRPYRQNVHLSSTEESLLRRDALETWMFFSETLNEKNHFLVPDSVRVGPLPKVASYTSITNIGFSLTSILVAHRLGYIATGKAKTLLQNIIRTLETLEKCEGHCYNWYEVDTARPAAPLFISSVDSGNLLAALIVVRQWFARGEKEIEPHSLAQGLDDIATLIAARLTNSTAYEEASRAWENIVSQVRTLRKTFAAQKKERSPKSTQRSASIRLACEALSRTLAESVSIRFFSPDTVMLFRVFETRLLDATKEYAHDDISGTHTESISPHHEKTLGSAERESWVRRLDTLIADMRFDFLKSPKRSLLSIGYHVSGKRQENRFYQTLASEARIANLLALAEGTLSFRGWNKLNRTVLDLPGGTALISWTGTLFEYLMPALFLEEHGDSLLGRSIKTAIEMNRRFAKGLRLPVWGLSESAYAEFDRSGNYRYKPFGLPSLSLSPFADNRAVVSAYPIMMALPYAPRAVLKNLEAYRERGGRGTYGYFESIDFHRSKHGVPVRLFMSHHQGMILAALGNALFDHFLIRLFESHPIVQNSLFVLDEGVPPTDKEPFPRPAPSYLQNTLIHPRTP